MLGVGADNGGEETMLMMMVVLSLVLWGLTLMFVLQANKLIWKELDDINLYNKNLTEFLQQEIINFRKNNDLATSG